MNLPALIIAFLIFLVFAGLAVFLGWIAVKSGKETFGVTEDKEGAAKHWPRFAAVFTGIVFMSSAISMGVAAFKLPAESYSGLSSNEDMTAGREAATALARERWLAENPDLATFFQT